MSNSLLAHFSVSSEARSCVSPLMSNKTTNELSILCKLSRSHTICAVCAYQFCIHDSVGVGTINLRKEKNIKMPKSKTNKTIIQNVDSSAVKRVEWDNKVLSVWFQTHTQYRHPNVSHETYQELINAPSIGRYYNENMRNLYVIKQE